MHDNKLLQKCQAVKYTKLCFNNMHLDELNVSWTTILVNLFLKSVIKNYHNDKTYNTILTTLFSVVWYVVVGGIGVCW